MKYGIASRYLYVFKTEDYDYKFLYPVSASGNVMQDMGGGHPMKGSVDIRYMIDVELKGGVLVMRRRIHLGERIDNLR
jgi:hypothetical protein